MDGTAPERCCSVETLTTPGHTGDGRRRCPFHWYTPRSRSGRQRQEPTAAATSAAGHSSAWSCRAPFATHLRTTFRSSSSRPKGTEGHSAAFCKCAQVHWRVGHSSLSKHCCHASPVIPSADRAMSHLVHVGYVPVSQQLTRAAPTTSGHSGYGPWTEFRKPVSPVDANQAKHLFRSACRLLDIGLPLGRSSPLENTVRTRK